jgi:hypothetical protein
VQKQAPTAKYNPTQGGGGGSPTGSDQDSRLDANARRAIGDLVRECWTIDNGALNVDKLQVLLEVTTDAQGTARMAAVAPEDRGNMGDPVFRAFAERAIRAILSPKCASFPLPKTMLGQPQTLKFRFRP